MKNYKIFTFLTASILVISSCKKSLDPVVYSSLTEKNAFVTKADAIAAVNSVYARLKGPAVGDNYDYWTVRHFALTDLATDLGHCDLGGDPGQLSNIEWNSSNGLILEDWRQIYKLISNANSAILNISPMTKIAEGDKTKFLAEIRFLRAIAYMDLTDLWGPVVLVTEKDLENPNYTSQPPLTSLADMNTFLIGELEFAASNLPLNYANNAIYPGNDVGRATKGAALGMLAKLYLRDHKWQKAADYSKQVMDLNIYSLFPSYAGLFAETNTWCSENIFSVLSDANVNGTELLNHFGPLNHPVLTDRWQYYAVTWDFYNTFANNDDRKKMFFAEYKGVDDLVHKQAPTLGAAPPEGEFYMPDVATSKYADPKGSNAYYDGHSVNILRFADILLSRAEALNEISGPTQESIDLINRVKSRSNATELQLANFNQASLRDALIQERGWELFYEGKRRADLIRTGKYAQIVNGYLGRINKSPSIVMPRDEFFPYPTNQVSINPNLTNAGRRN
ncbi:hypothetical protein ACVWYG_001442 [Pedobacter sp. UYEF25]